MRQHSNLAKDTAEVLDCGCESASDQKSQSRCVALRRPYLQAAINETNPIGFGFIDENGGGPGVRLHKRQRPKQSK